MFINDAKRTVWPSFLASSTTSFLVSDFRLLSCWPFFEFFPLSVNSGFRVRDFRRLGCWDTFTHHIAMSRRVDAWYLQAPRRLTCPFEAHPPSSTRLRVLETAVCLIPASDNTFPVLYDHDHWQLHPNFQVPVATTPSRNPHCARAGVRLAGDPVDGDSGTRFP